MKQELTDLSRQIKLIKLTKDIAFYEEGWWMKRRDYDEANSRKAKFLTPLCFDINWDTRQITTFILP